MVEFADFGNVIQGSIVGDFSLCEGELDRSCGVDEMVRTAVEPQGAGTAQNADK